MQFISFETAQKIFGSLPS